MLETNYSKVFCGVFLIFSITSGGISQLNVPGPRAIDLELENATLTEVLSAARRIVPFDVIVDGGAERRARFRFRGTLEALLSSAGDVFDYNWTRSANNTFLMRKRFHFETSRPQAIRSELQDSIGRMVEALRHVPVNLSRPITFAFRDLFLSISHIELAQLRAGQKLTLVDLGPAPRQFAQEAILLDCFDRTAEAIFALHAFLSNIEKGTLSLRSESTNTHEFSATYMNVVLQIPLNGRISQTIIARRPKEKTE